MPLLTVGLLSNFPIELFVSDEKPVTDVMGEKKRHNIIGFLIDEKIAVPGAPVLARLIGFVSSGRSAHRRAFWPIGQYGDPGP